MVFHDEFYCKVCMGHRVGELYVSPCGRHILFFSVYVRPSVRLSVRPSVCNAFLSEPYLQEPFMQKKIAKKFKNNIFTEVVQRKIKIQFCQKLPKVLAEKPLFGFVFCPGQISVTIKDRDTGIFCSVSKNIPIVQR